MLLLFAAELSSSAVGTGFNVSQLQLVCFGLPFLASSFDTIAPFLLVTMYSRPDKRELLLT